MGVGCGRTHPNCEQLLLVVDQEKGMDKRKAFCCCSSFAHLTSTPTDKFIHPASVPAYSVSDIRTSFFGFPMWIEEPDDSLTDTGISFLKPSIQTEEQQLPSRIFQAS